MKLLKKLFDGAGEKNPAFLYLPTLIAIIVVTYGAYYVESQNARINIQEQRNEVLQEIEHIRAHFERNINSNIQLAQGIVAAISIEPNMSQTRYSALASHLFTNEHQIKNIAAAPGLIVSMVYPEAENQSLIGLDYNGNEEQILAIKRARDYNSVVLDGPVRLVQGGTGYIVRIPVFLGSSEGNEQFWGIVSAVVDAETLYSQSGMLNSDARRLVLSKTTMENENLIEVFSNSSGQLVNPVSMEIRLGQEIFILSATPKDGWTDGSPHLWQNRVLAFLTGFVVVFPIALTGWLMGERQKNIVRLRNSAEKLKRVSRRLELALSTSQIGVWEFEVVTENLFWDDRMCELYDISSGKKPEYQDWVDRLHPDDLEEAEKDFSLALVERKIYQSQFRIIQRDGSVHHIRTIGSITEDENGNVRIVGVNWDITDDVAKNTQLESAKNLSEARNMELEETKVRIEHNSLHDSLTGLPNRRYLDEVLAGNYVKQFGLVENYSLLHIDLDRFKQINDTLGHAAGDTTLVHTAEVLSKNVRATDFVARVGGDEFVILCTSRMETNFLTRLATRINEEMRRPITINMRESRCGVSIGIAGYDSVHGDSAQLLINADIALYHAKRQGRNTFRFYTKKLHQVAVNTKCVADEILTGIEQNQFIVHYQGQFDAKTLEINGVEALARWQHPTRGLLGPEAFIDIAEELNVMAKIDQQVLGIALKQMKSWKHNGVEVPRVSVNISARRLSDERLIEGLKALNIKPGTLTFEFLETILLESTSEQVTWNIDQIRELGIDIELDDFGTGYASIVSLMQLRPKMLKIDRQLVMPVTESATQRELVQSIVNIGSALGIGAVAEGVETMEHARIMAELGCKTLQGYGLARPMSGRAFTGFVRKTAKNPLRAA